MTTFQDVYAQLDKILLDFDVSIRCSDLFERLLQVYAFKLSNTELWYKKEYSITFQPAEGQNDKVAFIVKNDEAHVAAFYEFLKEKCDPHAILNKASSTVIVSAQKCLENLVPFFHQLMNSLRDNKVPELTPHKYASEYDPRILRKYYEYREFMNAPNNPFGQMMREFDLNLTNLFISPYYTYVLGYSLLKMAGEQNSAFEEQSSDTFRVDMTGIYPEDIRYVDRGWGFVGYFGFDMSERIDINPTKNGDMIDINLAFKYRRYIEKINELLKKYCKIEFTDQGEVVGMGSRLCQAKLTVSGKEFYENFVPALSKYLLALPKDPLPFLYQKYLDLSVEDPAVILAKTKGPAATSWTSLNVKFPEVVRKKPDSPTEKKKKHSEGCCTLFRNIFHKIDPQNHHSDKYLIRR